MVKRGMIMRSGLRTVRIGVRITKFTTGVILNLGKVLKSCGNVKSRMSGIPEFFNSNFEFLGTCRKG